MGQTCEKTSAKDGGGNRGMWKTKENMENSATRLECWKQQKDRTNRKDFREVP